MKIPQGEGQGDEKQKSGKLAPGDPGRGILGMDRAFGRERFGIAISEVRRRRGGIEVEEREARRRDNIVEG